MERSLYSLIYAVFVVCVIACAQAQEDLKVEFEGEGTRYVTKGETDLMFKCTINRGVMFVVQNTVEIVRVLPNGTQNILTQSAKLVDAEPQYYDVSIAPVNSDGIEIDFKISEVRPIDDATLLCRVTKENPREIIEDSVEVVVLRPLTSLSLQFADYTPLTESTENPISVDAGKYSVKCIAEGSNPPVQEIHLTLAGEMVSHSAPVEEVIDGPIRTFRVSITGQVELKVEDSGNTFECTASSKLGDVMSTKLPIEINVYEPEIMCNDSQAYEGKMYPTLECVVNHEGLQIAGFSYQLDDEGGPHYEEISAGEENDDYVGVKTEPISHSKTKVILDLYKAKGWHFDSNFYLIVKHVDGHTSREVVNLRQTEARGGSRGPEDSSSMTKASLALLLLSVMCACLWF